MGAQHDTMFWSQTLPRYLAMPGVYVGGEGVCLAISCGNDIGH